MPRINESYQPETQEATHRPPGSPRPREKKSQKAQLNSKHKHGTRGDVKRQMSEKMGRLETYNQ